MVSDDLNVRRGDTWSQQLLGLGDLTGWTEIWFTVKSSYSDSDIEAIVAIEQTVGLVRLNGAATTAAWGSITVNNVVNGDLTLALEPEATSELEVTSYAYDVQAIIGGVVTTYAFGNFTVPGDVTRAIS